MDTRVGERGDCRGRGLEVEGGIRGINGNGKDTIKNKLSKKMEKAPGSCGLVDGALAREPKGHQFDSRSGDMPGLQARSPVGCI